MTAATRPKSQMKPIKDFLIPLEAKQCSENRPAWCIQLCLPTMEAMKHFQGIRGNHRLFNDRCIHLNSILSVHQEIRSLRSLSVFYFLYYNCCFTLWRESGISVSLSAFLNTALRAITPSNHSLSDVIIPLK